MIGILEKSFIIHKPERISSVLKRFYRQAKIQLRTELRVRGRELALFIIFCNIHVNIVENLTLRSWHFTGRTRTRILRRVNRKVYFQNSSKKDKTWTELLVSYLPFLLGLIWPLLPLGYILFGDIPTLIFSLLSQEQQRNFTYVSLSFLMECLALLPFFLLLYVCAFYLMSFILTLNGNLWAELNRLQK